MPLLKKKPVPLVEPPKDLQPHELVFQVRFTKEIFRDYHDYLNRINLYRQRFWMCKVTGRTGLTYEEALVSEKRACEKVQDIPKELMAPALAIIQYSTLPLRELADEIYEKLQERLFVGAELHGRKDNDLCPCKILKVLEEDINNIRYEVGWLDKNKKIIERAEIKGEDLIWKKTFNKTVLKSFIRNSTYRNAPWVLYDELARDHGISTAVPEELRGKIVFKNGLVACIKKSANEEIKGESGNKRKKLEGVNFVEEEDHLAKEEVKYPIDDLLVKPSLDDPVFADRPSPSREFNVPMDCVGDLLMVWDFCASFSRLLNLWPYSFEDFENAICHKESNVVLLVETHAVLLRLLIKDNDEYFLALHKRKRKSKITLITWTDYLCDFLEMINIPELGHNAATIKRGHYGLLDTQIKLGIFKELVNQALETGTIREKLDELIEERQTLGATRRGEALEEARKRREEKKKMKFESKSNGSLDGNGVESLTSVSAKCSQSRQNGELPEKGNEELEPCYEGDSFKSIQSKHSQAAPKRTSKRNVDMNMPIENGKELSTRSLQEQVKDDKGISEKSSKDQRREYYERELEKRFIRCSPLGKDRYYNRYWWFRRDGRIFVESSDSKEWGYYGSKKELDALMGSLNYKGVRERALKQQLEKYYSRICTGIHKKSKDETLQVALDESVLRRSTRVRAPPRENPANAFLRYVNKWKLD